MTQPLWKTVWRFLRKLNIELRHDPAVPLLGMYPDQTIVQKDTCTPRFSAALCTIARTGNYLNIYGQMNERIKKMCLKELPLWRSGNESD